MISQLLTIFVSLSCCFVPFLSRKMVNIITNVKTLVLPIIHKTTLPSPPNTRMRAVLFFRAVVSLKHVNIKQAQLYSKLTSSYQAGSTQLQANIFISSRLNSAPSKHLHIKQTQLSSTLTSSYIKQAQLMQLQVNIFI
jgi:hypothetical protein